MKLDKTGNEDAGCQFAKIEKAINGLDAQSLAELDTSGLTVATANASVGAPLGADGTTAATLANDLKAKFNLLISRLEALQP